eukprot:3306456-Pleurochrysis_carterae.AAC.2
MHSLESGVVVDDDQGVAATAVDGRLERAGEVDMYEPTGIRRLDAQDGAGAWRRLRGASQVKSVRRLRCAPPQCKRRCIKWAASLADMT